MKDKNLMWLLIILLVKAFIIALIVLFGGIHLSPDEAQYWTWSQALDFGYYSKPPGIAWEIFIGTAIFQNNEFGIRFFAMVIGFLLPIATYFLALKCKLKETTAFFAALMMAFSPIGFAASFFATTDGSMVLFWVLASIVLVDGFNKKAGPNYLILGLILAFGALFKWPIYIFWIFPILLKRYWKKSLIFGILISTLGLLPSLIWNLKHDFATFKHVFSTVKGTSNPFSGNFFEFFAAQIGLVSPILFLLMIISMVYLFKEFKKTSNEIRFCLILPLAILIPFLFGALFKKMQGNWAVFAYPLSFVFTAYVMLERKEYGKKWVKIGIGLSIVLTTLLISIPRLQMSGVSIPYRFNAFRHNMGWDQLPRILSDVGYNPEKDFLFGDKYQTSSILSFYSPGKKTAYFLNLHGIRNNQFSYWKSMKDVEMHNTGYFVLTENSPHLEKEPEKRIEEHIKLLSPYFETVEFLRIEPLFTVDGKTVKGAFIFKATNYNGTLPAESSLY